MKPSGGNPLSSAADRGTKSTLLGISVNSALGLAKCSTGLLGNSFALVADGLESITDVLDHRRIADAAILGRTDSRQRAALLADVLQIRRTSDHLARIAGDRTQVLVDCPELVVGHVLEKRPSHHLE
jgi:hypothetical protein